MNKNFFRYLEDNIEHFLGIEVNEKKLARLNEMQQLCRELADADRSIKNRFKPFSTKDKNASVALDIQSPLWTFDTSIAKKIARLFEMSDGFAIASGDDGSVRITFDVLDMWDKFGYDNDMEQGK